MRNSQLGPTLWAAYVRALASTHGARGFTIRQLAERFEISIATSRIWMKALHANNCVFIIEWKLHSRQWTPFYAWGVAEHDKARPPPKGSIAARERKSAYTRAKRLAQKQAEMRTWMQT